jgi:hypothetical protein
MRKKERAVRLQTLAQQMQAREAAKKKLPPDMSLSQAAAILDGQPLTREDCDKMTKEFQETVDWVCSLQAKRGDVIPQGLALAAQDIMHGFKETANAMCTLNESYDRLMLRTAIPEVQEVHEVWVWDDLSRSLNDLRLRNPDEG